MSVAAMDDPGRGADRAARIWRGDGGDPVRPGSARHRDLYCRMLLDTFNPYKPADHRLAQARRRRRATGW